jgi:hypothetical protein
VSGDVPPAHSSPSLAPSSAALSSLAAAPPKLALTAAHRGVQLRLHEVRLGGVATVRLVSLHAQVACARCRLTLEFTLGATSLGSAAPAAAAAATHPRLFR